MPTLAPPTTKVSSRAPVQTADLPAGVAPSSKLPLAGILLLATVVFGVGLSSSSLFIDEVYSWHAVRGDMGQLLDALKLSEVTPPLYYFVLDAWLWLTGSDSEVVMRLPSVVAGVALVGAVYWLATLIAGRNAGLVAAALTAVNPLTLLYAQQVRAYIFVMLAVTVAAATAIQAVRQPSTRRFVIAALTAALALCTHYTALLALAPIAVWMLSQSQIDPRFKVGYLLALLAPLAALAPLALEQTSRGHHGSTADYASLTSFNLLRLFGTPFDGRMTDGMILSREIGALVVVEVLALLAFADRFRRVRDRRLLAAAAFVPIVAIVLVSAFVVPMALTRYTVVAAPFVLVGIGTLVVHTPRPLAISLVSAALLASVPPVLASNTAAGRHPDLRGAVATAAAGWQHGDVMVSVELLGFDGALSYYAERDLPRGERDLHAFATLEEAAFAAPVFDAASSGRALWIVSDPPMRPAELTRALIRLGYEVGATRSFAGNSRLQLVRAVPAR